MVLEVIQIPASDMDNFSYLLYCPGTKEAAAVDPSLYPERLLAKAREIGVTISVLLNTHGHHDHIAGNATIVNATGAKLAAHPVEVNHADIRLAEGSTIPIGKGQVEVMHTPGHTPGSLVFKAGSKLITGDTLFVSRCGRADLPGSEVTDLYQSLQRLKTLPEDYTVYPGHDYGPQPVSTIGWELQHNDYLKCPDLQSFIRLRMG